MSLLQSIKPFWPLLLTFVLPRLISLLRTLRVAIRTRPQPTPLPRKSRTALNILFASIIFFLVLSIKPPSGPPTDNIFTTTASRLSLPTDALFSRLAIARKSIGGLTEFDEALREKLASRTGRELYLRFGPRTLVYCRFCEKEDAWSYALFHLPTNVLLWHLVHFGVVGMATSQGLCGFEVSRWRSWVLLGTGALVAVDLGAVLGLEVKVDVNGLPPIGVFWIGRTVRPLVICLFDGLVAGVLWMRVTGRLLIFSGGVVDGEVMRRKNNELLGKSTLLLQSAQTKLRAANVLRNAVVRDRVLSGVEDGYWRDVSEVEARDGLGGGDAGMRGSWEDEDVQKAMAKAYGQGSIDVRSMRKEAEGFVKAVTGHMDGQGGG